VETFAHVVERAPYDGDAWNVYGVLLFEVGRLEDATAALERAAHLTPANVSYLTNLLRVLYAQGRYGDALRHVGEVGALAAQIPAARSGQLTHDLKTRVEQLMDETQRAPRSADVAAALVEACWTVLHEAAVQLLAPAIRGQQGQQSQT
jgi:Flp pilus assembly protein TadD